MAVPAANWAELEPDAKRARILAAAAELFAQEGLDAPMPALAAAIGAGVGSLYRCYPSKQDLVAALVVARLEETRTAVEAALAADGDAWQSLCEILWAIAERQAGDNLFGKATELVAGDPQVLRAKAAATAAFDELLARARAAGRSRSDANGRDVLLLFAATRAARAVDADGWRRVLELFLDALAVRPDEPAKAARSRATK
jgi:AcrR family transcriptional regulator